MMNAIINLIIVFILFFISGCSLKNQNTALNNLDSDYIFSGIERTYNFKAINPLLQTIDKYKNKKTRLDCSGFVDFLNKKNDDIFYKNQDVYKYINKNGGRAQAIYNFYKKNGRIIDKNVRAGDLIFFNNTTEKTKNKKQKIITHIGVVKSVYKNGIVEFIHSTRGINKIGYINLNYKDVFKKGNIIQNSYIIRCKKNRTSCLASNRFAGFGAI